MITTVIVAFVSMVAAFIGGRWTGGRKASDADTIRDLRAAEDVHAKAAAARAADPGADPADRLRRAGRLRDE